MRSFKLEGIILKRQNVGEADRILTVFTKNQGKIRVKAIGVRRITSRRSSHVEPLNNVILSLYSARNLPILTEVQTTEDFSEIKQNLSKVGFAYHLCELIDALCPENQESTEIFSLFKATLQKLCSQEAISPIVNQFELALLAHLGFYSKRENSTYFDTTAFIEGILEKKLKTKEILLRLL